MIFMIKNCYIITMKYLPQMKYSCLYHPQQIDTRGAQVYSAQHPMFLCVNLMKEQQQGVEQVVTTLLRGKKKFTT
jgi:hypothetical protein